jgi:hypothetical protein
VLLTLLSLYLGELHCFSLKQKDLFNGEGKGVARDQLNLKSSAILSRRESLSQSLHHTPSYFHRYPYYLSHACRITCRDKTKRDKAINTPRLRNLVFCTYRGFRRAHSVPFVWIFVFSDVGSGKEGGSGQVLLHEGYELGLEMLLLFLLMIE